MYLQTSETWLVTVIISSSRAWRVYCRHKWVKLACIVQQQDRGEN